MTSNATQQKKYKPLIFTGVIPVIEKNKKVKFMNGNIVAIGKYCSLYDKNPGSTFDPKQYCVMVIKKMETDTETNKPVEKTMRFITDLTQEMLTSYIKVQNQAQYQKTRPAFESSLKPGDKVHLFSKQGIYSIVSIYGHPGLMTAKLTCNQWVMQEQRGEGKAVQQFFLSEIKCLAGGLHNAVFN
jgi:hypothetical protein